MFKLFFLLTKTGPCSANAI